MVDKEQLAKLLRKHNGNFAAVARQMKCTRANIHKIVSRNKKLTKLVEEIRQSVIDEAEDRLLKHLRSDNEAISFKAAEKILETIGADRGYVKKVGATDAERVNINIVTSGVKKK